MSDLRVEQFVAAPPATVYRYFTEAAKWAEWQGESATVDPRPGGRFSLLMSNGQRAEGEFVELDPDLRVVFTWGWVGHPDLPPGSTRVEIDLAEEPTGTLVILTHRFLPEDELEPHREGGPRTCAGSRRSPPAPDDSSPSLGQPGKPSAALLTHRNPQHTIEAKLRQTYRTFTL